MSVGSEVKRSIVGPGWVREGAIESHIMPFRGMVLPRKECGLCGALAAEGM